MTKRKDGRYQEVVTINGKRKYFYGATKAEVLRKVNAYREEDKRGKTISVLCDEWFEHHTPKVGYKAAESYSPPIKQIKDAFGDLRASEITPPMVSAFIRRIESRGYARRTVQLRLDVLRMVLDYVITEYGCIDVNPCQSVTLSKHLRSSKRELPSSSDIAAIVEHAKDDRFSLLPFILCYTGLRLGEALALTDKDFRDGVICVSKKVSWQPNSPVIELWAKTDRGIREVPLLDVVKDALPEWSGYLFSDDGKKPYTKSAFQCRWKKYAKRTGVTTIRHTLRHEFATLLYDAKVDTKEAAEMLGHDESVMRSIYTHITDNRRKKTAQKLNEYVNSVSNNPESAENA